MRLPWGQGNDTLRGDQGSDVLSGGGEDDELIGGRGQDTLNGGGGKDILKGNNGADSLNGGSGRDFLTGQRGNDILDGGANDDILSGGKGSDIFILAVGNGRDTITDFEGSDRIRLTQGLDLGDLTFSDNNIILTSSNKILATLTGIVTTTLAPSHFIS